MKAGDFVLCVYPATFEWRAYEIASYLGGKKNAFRSARVYEPKSREWKEDRSIVTTTEVTVLHFAPDEPLTPLAYQRVAERPIPKEMIYTVDKLTEALEQMHSEKKKARDRYLVHISLLVPGMTGS